MLSLLDNLLGFGTRRRMTQTETESSMDNSPKSPKPTNIEDSELCKVTVQGSHICRECLNDTRINIEVQIRGATLVADKVRFEQREGGDTICIFGVRMPGALDAPTTSTRQSKHYALYDFTAKSAAELPLKKGEFVTVLEEADSGRLSFNIAVKYTNILSGWWLVKNSRDERAWVPGKYLKEEERPTPVAPERRPTPPPPYA
jgi:hypothetical protein